jgi:hypothetical protein
MREGLASAFFSSAPAISHVTRGGCLGHTKHDQEDSFHGHRLTLRDLSRLSLGALQME